MHSRLIGPALVAVLVAACAQQPDESDEEMAKAATTQAFSTATLKPAATFTTVPPPSEIPPTATPISLPTSISSPLGTEGYDDVYPAWSPDGTRIAYSSLRDGDPDIYVMDADGSNVVQLTYDQDLVIHSFLAATSNLGDFWPSWSPDGSRIAFASARDNIYWTYIDFNIYSVQIGKPEPIQLTIDAEMDSHPTWSPDGSRIAFTSGAFRPQIFVIDSDGANLEQLTHHSMSAGFPSWSPDGTRIAFMAGEVSKADIYIVDAGGVSETRLTYDPAADQLPAWSPDGNQIAFASDRAGNFDIYVMEADGSNVMQLTHDPETDSAPAWSPDGSRIVFHSYRDGDADIYVMDADGSNVVQLTLDEPLTYDLQTPEGNFERALGHISRGDLDAAVADLDAAIMLDSDYAAAYLARGMIYGHPISPLTDPARAIPDLQTALELGIDPVMRLVAEIILEALEAMDQ